MVTGSTLTGVVLPFSLSGVSLWQAGASSLRVRLARGERDAVSLLRLTRTESPSSR